MSGIARLLLGRGFTVSGSDLKENRVTQELKRLGARIFLGHNALNINGADAIIYSSAIKEDNPEVIEAKKNNIPLKKRALGLAELMQDKTVITVTGSHGKTTTSSLISYLLLEAGLQPTIAVGGILRNIDSNAYLGDGKFFVAEADESDGSFLYYYPDYSIITNIDREHLDYYQSFEKEIAAFSEFINQTKKNGCILGCSDDPVLKKLLDHYQGRHISFGLKKDADVYPANITMSILSSEFDCFYQGKFVQRFRLALGGLHNISNSLAVIGLGLELNLKLECIRKSLSSYQGSERRLEVKFQNSDFLVIDDYAHHPTEIKATLAAVRELKAKRVIAVFQPHRYSRTQLLWDDFAHSFDLVDYLVVTDIYPASEKPLLGISGEALCRKIKENKPGGETYFLAKEEITEHLLRIKQPGDLVIMLGAGDIVKTCDELVNKIKG